MNKYERAYKAIALELLMIDENLEIDKELELIYKLVERATLKKPYLQDDEDDILLCPNCNQDFIDNHISDFCPNCGQKLD